MKILNKYIKLIEQIGIYIPEDGWKNVAVPLHPGAEKYYKEAGYME